MSSTPITDSDVVRFCDIAQSLSSQADAKSNMWRGSPFRWIALNLPSRSRGKVFEDLVRKWCAEHSMKIGAASGTQADIMIDGVRVEVKGSTLWTGNKIYKFQQIRDQNYRLLVCLGISPFDVHSWVMPKEIAMQAWQDGLEGIETQHGGKGGSDTAWLGFVASNPPEWLQPYGGHLRDMCRLIRQFSS